MHAGKVRKMVGKYSTCYLFGFAFYIFNYISVSDLFTSYQFYFCLFCVILLLINKHFICLIKKRKDTNNSWVFQQLPFSHCRKHTMLARNTLVWPVLCNLTLTRAISKERTPVEKTHPKD